MRRSRRVGALVAGLMLLSLPGLASSPATPRQRSVVVEKNVEAVMRDGVVLRADVYRPDAPGRFPALLRRTPYSKNSEGSSDRLRRVSAQGYVVVV